MDGGTWAAIIAAVVVLIAAARDVVSLWIRAHYRWRNGAPPPPDDPPVQ